MFSTFLSIDCDNLDDHLANRELHLAGLGKSHCSGNTAQRRDFAKEYVNAIMHGAGLYPSDIQQPANAVLDIFTKYNVLPTAKPPLWLKNLHTDMKTIGPAVVNHPAHDDILFALRADPDRSHKTSSWPAAIHYVLAQYESDMLDAACSFGANIKLIAISDQSDGMYWLRHSFPLDRSCTTVFDEMSKHIRTVTGISDATIREKPIPLPNLPARKTPFFQINDWPNNASKALLPELMKLMDRHFTTISGLSKAFIVERYFHLETDITSKLIMRTVAETKLIYSSCKVIMVDGKSADDKPITKPILDLWLDRTDRPVKQSVDFLATQVERDASPEVLSSFNGLLLETTEPMDHAAAASDPGVQQILELILRILAGGDDASYTYILGWLASGLQNYRKIGVILCFVGAAGAGKSHLFSQTAENLPIMQTLYDGVEGYYMSGQGLDDIVARFNLMSTAKLFAVCEELQSSSPSARSSSPTPPRRTWISSSTRRTQPTSPSRPSMPTPSATWTGRMSSASPTMRMHSGSTQTRAPCRASLPSLKPPTSTAKIAETVTPPSMLRHLYSSRPLTMRSAPRPHSVPSSGSSRPLTLASGARTASLRRRSSRVTRQLPTPSPTGSKPSS